MINRNKLNQIARTIDGVPVLGVVPGSPSHKAGVRYGDILIEVNGTRTRTLDDYVTAKALQNDSISLKIFRDGEELSLNFNLDHSRDEMSNQDLAKVIDEMRVLTPEGEALSNKEIVKN